MAESDEQAEEGGDAGQRPKFPVIPTSHWWALRKKFKQSIPPTVDAKYIAASLNMEEQSARNNVLPALRKFGIIDDSGKTNMALATRWREDALYPAVCRELLTKVYPDSLRHVAPKPLEDKDAVRRWFAGHGVGEALVKKATAIYFLLNEADPAKASDRPVREAGQVKPRAAANRSTAAKAMDVQRALNQPKDDHGNRDEQAEADAAAARAAAAAQMAMMKKAIGPQLHLNVQIHISPETTPEQIESIFASMAKHLKTLNE